MCDSPFIMYEIYRRKLLIRLYSYEYCEQNRTACMKERWIRKQVEERREMALR